MNCAYSCFSASSNASNVRGTSGRDASRYSSQFTQRRTNSRLYRAGDEQMARDREDQRGFRAGIRRQPHVRLGRRVRQARIDDDEPRAARLAFDDALRVRIEIVARLEMRRQQQNRSRVRVIG